MKKIRHYFRKAWLNCWKRVIFKSKNVTFGKNVIIDSEDKFEGNNCLQKMSKLYSSKIGFGSYIAAASHLQFVEVGKYTSIGPRVYNIVGRHPTRKFVSTHPAFYSTQMNVGFSYVENERFEEICYIDSDKKFVNHIGSDVWIGSDVIILDGCSIDDGAIIAAGAVVTKDIPPYAVAGGVPAKIIRYRFDEDDIKFLLELQWWNKEEAWICGHADLFSDIKLLRKKLEEEMKTKSFGGQALK